MADKKLPSEMGTFELVQAVCLLTLVKLLYQIGHLLYLLQEKLDAVAEKLNKYCAKKYYYVHDFSDDET